MMGRLEHASRRSAKGFSDQAKAFYSEFVAQHRHWTLVLVLGFCLAIAATFFFGYRAGRTARHYRWQDEPIQPWMSVPFVAHTHHTRTELLFQAIHLPPNLRDHRPIREIARAERLPVAELIRELRSAIANANPPESRTVPPSGKAPGKAP
jgi:hypothetical protein